MKKGKERKGRQGKERKGKERKEKERKGREGKEREGRGRERKEGHLVAISYSWMILPRKKVDTHLNTMSPSPCRGGSGDIGILS